MRRRLCIAVVLIVLTAVLCSCGSDALGAGDDLTNKTRPDENSTYNFVSGETELPNTYTSYKNNAQNFSFELLRSLYKDDKNAFYSPAALYGQLSLMENACAGASKSQLKSLLNKDLSADELNSSSGYFFSRLSSLSDSAEGACVDVKNNAFFSDRLTVGQNFIRTNANFYSQGLFRLNFSDGGTLPRINSYIGSQSGGFSDGLITSLDADKGITLSETVSFSDKWLAGYPPESVSSGTFKGNRTAEATYLNSVEYFLTAKGCKGFVKDFKNTPCKFIAILPDGDIGTLIDKLDSGLYQELVDSMDIMTTCEVSIPAFSADYRGDLSDALKRSGVKSIFTDSANFNGLSYNCSAQVDSIMQWARLSITASGADGGDAVISENKKPEAKHKLSLNRPFIYIIADNESYIPVLMGVLTDYEAIS